MKEIKADVHRSRIAGVIQALKESGLRDFGGESGGRSVTVYEVKGSLEPQDSDEQHYSMDLAEAVVHQFKLELISEDAITDRLVDVIRTAARTGQENAGCGSAWSTWNAWGRSTGREVRMVRRGREDGGPADVCSAARRMKALSGPCPAVPVCPRQRSTLGEASYQ